MISGAGNLLNAVLDAILIFIFNLGIDGAAISTVISEYVNDVVNLIILVYFQLEAPFVKSVCMLSKTNRTF